MESEDSCGFNPPKETSREEVKKFIYWMWEALDDRGYELFSLTDEDAEAMAEELEKRFMR